MLELRKHYKQGKGELISSNHTLIARWLWKVPGPTGDTAWFQMATPLAEEIEVLEKAVILKIFPPEQDSGGK